MTSYLKNKSIKSPKIRKSAEGETCSLRISAKCTDQYGAVVLCHIGRISGTAAKCHDTFAVYGCNYCHDIIDGKVKTDLTPWEIDTEKLRALEETQSKLIQKGLIKI